jgi:hypothetical protein
MTENLSGSDTGSGGADLDKQQTPRRNQPSRARSRSPQKSCARV